jgi:hypothetical protein
LAEAGAAFAITVALRAARRHEDTTNTKLFFLKEFFVPFVPSSLRELRSEAVCTS